jgi:hypothetical protein
MWILTSATASAHSRVGVFVGVPGWWAPPYIAYPYPGYYAYPPP